MLMPDPNRIPEEAPGFEPTAATIGWYRGLPKQFRGYWDSFGKGAKEPPPAMKPPDQVNDADVARANFKNYAVTAMGLRQSITELNESAKKLAPLAQKFEAISEAGRKELNKSIDIINTEAPAVPKPGMKEDQHIYEYVDRAVEAAIGALDKARNASDREAKGVDEETKKLKELEDKIKQLEAEKAALQRRLADPVNITPPPSTPPYATNPPYVDTGDFPTGLDGLDDGSGLDGLTPPGVDSSDPSGINGQSPGGLGNLGDTPGVTPTTPAVQPAAATSPMGSGMDMMSSMLPMMMQQAMMRNLADQDLNNRRRELDPDRFEDELTPAAPPPVTAPVTAQPATVQQSTTAPATHHGQPTGTTSSTQPAGAPARMPDADGSVMYTHPDGVTEKLNVTAAQAFDKAYGNHTDTDAKKAYEGTPAMWKDEEELRLLRVMPEDKERFTSGCVVVFKGGKTALLRVAPDKGDGFHVVIKGELKPFDQNMPELASEEGSFDGFRRPNGIDVTAPADKGVPLSTPGSADQSANAAMPVVAAG